MSIRSLLSSLLLLGVLILLAVSTAAREQNSTAYHLSRFAIHADRVEREYAGKTWPTLAIRVYGGVVSHHIPQTIPNLVDFYGRLKASQHVEEVIIIGPDHTDAGRAPVTASAQSFATPFGVLDPIPTLAKTLAQQNLVNIEESPFGFEHSIGSQVLVIAKLFPKARITPIIIRSDTSLAHAKALGKIVGRRLDGDTILIASIDFSHYLPADQARPIDRLSGEILQNLAADFFASIEADSNKAAAVFITAMREAKAHTTEALQVLNTDDVMQNSDYTTGYVFGYWGK